MPRLATSALGLALTALAATSCTAPTQETSTQETSAQDSAQESLATQTDLEVITTFLPITNFTKAVVGDLAEVTQLMPPSVDPHDYQAKPQDIQRIAQADVLVKNGLSFESFLDDLTESAGNSQLVVVDTSEGVESIEAKGDHGHDDHAHEHEGDLDPHIWLDPKKAIQQVENIRDAMVEADPENAEIYTQNAANYIDELGKLDAEITQTLAPYADRTFVTYHDFAAQFAQSYDLDVEYLVAIPEASASPDDVRRVIEAAQSSNLKTLLSEPYQGSSPFETVAEDLDVAVSVFDPIENGGADSAEPAYYLSTMRENVKNLQTAFEASDD